MEKYKGRIPGLFSIGQSPHRVGGAIVVVSRGWNHCLTNSGSPEVELRFCLYGLNILFKY